MTYCEEIGLKVGDKIRVLAGGRFRFPRGEIITLSRDDRDKCPVFRLQDGSFRFFNLDSTGFGGEGVAWERVVDEDDTAKTLTAQLAEAVKKRDNQAEKVRKHQERLAECESTVNQLRIKLENEIEKATTLPCRIGGEEVVGSVGKRPEFGTVRLQFEWADGAHEKLLEAIEKADEKPGDRGADIPDGVDVDDPKTWCDGDIIECVFTDREWLTEGKEYVFDGVDQDDDPYVLEDDNGDHAAPFASDAKFRFVRRPVEE